MLQKFKAFAEFHQLFSHNTKIIVAVSGGPDSMALLHLLTQIPKLELAVAHCNFQLRGAESEADEQLVKSTALAFNLPFYSKRFNTAEVVEESNQSIQMIARELRYTWFNELLKTLNFHAIAVGTNATDSVETSLLNFSKGTGLLGLTGIKPINQTLIRPLLFAAKTELEQYCMNHQIAFRTDASNAKNEYQRNRIRNKILPEFQKINPNAIHSMLNNTQQLNDEYELLQNLLHHQFEELVEQVQTNEWTINRVGLSNIKNSYLVAHYISSKLHFDFSRTQWQQLLNTYSVGAQLIQGSDRAYLEKEVVRLLRMGPPEKKELVQIYHATPSKYSINNATITLEICKQLPKSVGLNEAFFDAAKVLFPLTIRAWKAGDFMIPFGKKKPQKISDLLVKNGVTGYKKQIALVLCDSSDNIIWLIGTKHSNLAKVQSSTHEVLHFILQLND